MTINLGYEWDRWHHPRQNDSLGLKSQSSHITFWEVGISTYQMALFSDHGSHEGLGVVKRLHFSRGFQICLQILRSTSGRYTRHINAAARLLGNTVNRYPSLSFVLPSFPLSAARLSEAVLPAIASSNWVKWSRFELFLLKGPTYYLVICWPTNLNSNSHANRV